VLFSLEWELVEGSLVNPNPLPLMKIGLSIFHFLAHLPIHLYFVPLERLKMHF
jgi:hypothetical protein